MSSYVFYLGYKNPTKVPILTLSIGLVKISQIPNVIFESKSQFSFKFSINIQCHQTYNSPYFLNSNIIHFGQRRPIKAQIFEIFECSDQNSSNSSCKFWTDKSIPFQFLHHSSLSWHKIPLKILSSKVFNFGQKNPIKVKCSGENLPNSSSYFPNHKSVFLQILNRSLVSWEITLLYIFRSTLTGRDQSKCKFCETFECSDQNSPNSCQFWNNKSVFLQIFYQSWVPSNITSLYFLSWSIIYFGQKQPIKVQIFEIFECLGQNLLNSSCQFWTSQFLFKFCIFLHCHNT